jgi:hypothetical protein
LLIRGYDRLFAGALQSVQFRCVTIISLINLPGLFMPPPLCLGNLLTFSAVDDPAIKTIHANNKTVVVTAPRNGFTVSASEDDMILYSIRTA